MDADGYSLRDLQEVGLVAGTRVRTRPVLETSMQGICALDGQDESMGRASELVALPEYG